MDQDHDQAARDLEEARLIFTLNAPPGWQVVDVWRCDTCCDAFHAVALSPEELSGSRAERREAARARRRGARRG